MKRRLAREIAVQCLYQIEMNGVSIGDALDMVFQEAREENEANVKLEDESALRLYSEELVAGVKSHEAPIDEALQQYLKGWRMDRLSRVDRQILRLAAFELIYREDVPPKVAVNEAIELAKHYGVEESGKFVNGVLGQFLKELDEVRERLTAYKDQ